MARGVETAARLPTKLNTPPVRPSMFGGASDVTRDHVMDAKPLPKNATAMKKMTQLVESVKLAPMMLVDISRPEMIGNLRAKPTLAPLRISQSENRPALMTAQKAARKGSEVRNPDLMKSMPRYLTRYVGNQVRKNHSVEPTAYWPR